MEPTSSPSESIPYASIASTPSHGHKVAAAFFVTLVGLGILVIGGCFLIGVMATLAKNFNQFAPAPTPLTAADTVFVTVLYALAFASFAAGALVILAGLRSLFRIIRA